ncbi:uncharacterized protein PV09_08420 [Verruconis gallopava]|uniref:Uncharacterized protein n=1 Tax=Verruconis gallopava TaxID=253628 RepID=A0A0D2A0D7_9PEZI|nr:uncharacterized protein PV09_08420 [Verruconis gallopava]KIW00078.1 hypothetical protein PV09_08420 [Verruconis gallopava]
MMRPKLRPSLSRRVKYWGIAPTAHKKLGKEARRGSHDLRRLVGHANFLDVLVSELDISDDEVDVTSSGSSKVLEECVPNEPSKEMGEGKMSSDDKDDSTSSDDDWLEYDDSDDEDHALVRTSSGRSTTIEGQITTQDDIESRSQSENLGDYFGYESTSMILSTPVLVQKSSPSNLDKKMESIVTVDLASTEMTPLPSPDDD